MQLNAVQEFVNRLANAARLHRNNHRPLSRPANEAELADLERLKRRAQAVSEMMSSEGWKVYVEELQSRSKSIVTNIMLTSPHEFASPANIERKGMVAGIEIALNTATDIISAGANAIQKIELANQKQSAIRIGK